MARYAVRSEPVRFRSGAELVAACLYLPRLPSPQPGLLVIQSGGEPPIQAQGIAERLAHVGYVTLSVDPYAGALERPASGTTLSGVPSSSRPTLSEPEHELDSRTAAAPITTHSQTLLTAALAWLRAHPLVKDGIAGAFGLGYGGDCALWLAAANPVYATVSIDGSGSAAPFLASARAPLLVVMPGAQLANGAGSEPPGAAVVGSSHVDSAGLPGTPCAHALPHEIVRYPFAAHGFFDERGPAFSPADAEDAWSRANKFFYKHLGEPGNH